MLGTCVDVFFNFRYVPWQLDIPARHDDDKLVPAFFLEEVPRYLWPQIGENRQVEVFSIFSDESIWYLCCGVPYSYLLLCRHRLSYGFTGILVSGIHTSGISPDGPRVNSSVKGWISSIVALSVVLLRLRRRLVLLFSMFRSYHMWRRFWGSLYIDRTSYSKYPFVVRRQIQVMLAGHLRKLKSFRLESSQLHPCLRKSKLACLIDWQPVLVSRFEELYGLNRS